MATASASYQSFISLNPITKTHNCSLSNNSMSILNPVSHSSRLTARSKPTHLWLKKPFAPRLSCTNSLSSISPNTSQYEFADGSSEVELRLQMGGQDNLSSKDVFVDADGSSLTVRVKRSGSLLTLIETNQLFDKIKPAETIWYIDDDELVINLKKQDPELKWPDIVESWESLTAGAMQLLKGTSIYLVGDSAEINEKVARELAVGLGY
ncbi:hypothetical protein Pint_03504 [Pistacia integerrima]|uniref:Uncharacterized protein n=1 Tax=Pistacia integerrima TaxID=434235 RepID=A0ACC0ZIU5_9ROSI|nr:hypothetical protein Pint_03504 [Pistacia integerrima]